MSARAVPRPHRVRYRPRMSASNDPSAVPPVDWLHARFDELAAADLHDALRLRVDVFVVEQACAYPEIDGLDGLPGTRHLLGRAHAEAVVYGRSLCEEDSPGSPVRLGRIVVARSWRGRGLARELMRRLLADAAARHPGRDVVLGAQLPAEPLYAAFGFERTSGEYLEDGIAHVDMRLARD